MNQRESSTGRIIVFIRSDAIGRGDDELGKNLMMNFLHHLSLTDIAPHMVVMMNAGVKLAAEGSEHLQSLEDLSKKGTEVLACGTCLDFFHLRQKLKVGRASNMAEITRILLQASEVITI